MIVFVIGFELFILRLMTAAYDRQRCRVGCRGGFV